MVLRMGGIVNRLRRQLEIRLAANGHLHYSNNLAQSPTNHKEVDDAIPCSFSPC
jgi:hypothetical protein